MSTQDETNAVMDAFGESFMKLVRERLQIDIQAFIMGWGPNETAVGIRVSLIDKKAPEHLKYDVFSESGLEITIPTSPGGAKIFLRSL